LNDASSHQRWYPALGISFLRAYSAARLIRRAKVAVAL
jgi:hypothetical protein